ncbi:unnamed protein product [Rhizoctonia solani]|uniref:Uncharacterized protein n=1 Tax=Rhizoctonia solani TaxID=456999 RepID=A0A8H3DLK6_9AGAM|nr:unnamed protein product [Rhizoctonia solani]
MEVAIHKRTPMRPQGVLPEGNVYGDKLWDILTKCWSYDPKDRLSTRDVWNRMELTTPETPRSPRPNRRNPRLNWEKKDEVDRR